MSLHFLAHYSQHAQQPNNHFCLSDTSSYPMCLCPGVAIAERLAPFKVKKFIYTDVEPRPELARAINAEYGKDQIHVSIRFSTEGIWKYHSRKSTDINN